MHTHTTTPQATTVAALAQALGADRQTLETWIPAHMPQPAQQPVLVEFWAGRTLLGTTTVQPDGTLRDSSVPVLDVAVAAVGTAAIDPAQRRPDADTCPGCGATPDEACRKGPGVTGDGHTSCGPDVSHDHPCVVRGPEGQHAGWVTSGGCANRHCLAAVRDGRPWHGTPSGFAVTLPDYHFATEAEARSAVLAAAAQHGYLRPVNERVAREEAVRAARHVRRELYAAADALPVDSQQRRELLAEASRVAAQVPA